MHGKFMVSFDIVSLFTNIPLEECIDLASSTFLGPVVRKPINANPRLKITKEFISLLPNVVQR